jgi:hypothetical protein
MVSQTSRCFRSGPLFHRTDVTSRHTRIAGRLIAIGPLGNSFSGTADLSATMTYLGMAKSADGTRDNVLLNRPEFVGGRLV